MDPPINIGSEQEKDFLNCSEDYSPNDKRLTRVLAKGDYVEYSGSEDDIVSEDGSFSNEYFEEDKSPGPSVKATDNAKEVVDQLSTFSAEQIGELLHKLEIDEVNEEERKGVPDVQHHKEDKNKKQNLKSKKKTKNDAIATEGNEIQNNENGVENKNTNKKNLSKGKKKEVMTSKQLGSSQHNLDTLQDETIKKKVNKDENTIMKSKSKNTVDVQEKEATKSKKEKSTNEGNIVKKNKASKTVIGNNTVKEQNEDTLMHGSNHPEGRVMRSTRARMEATHQGLKEVNEKSLDTVPLKHENKAAPLVEDGVVEPKKKAGKKATTASKSVDEKLAPPVNKEENKVGVKKPAKKEVRDINVLQENPPSLNKETKASKTQKNTKNEDLDVGNNEKEIDEKPKRKPPNRKAATEPPSDAEKPKMKTKLEPAKNKKTLANKENKEKVETVVNKRTERKK